MFEGIVSDLVVKICGDYIHGINKENLNVSVWSGKPRHFFPDEIESNPHDPVRRASET